MKSFEKHIQKKADSFEMNPMPDSFDKIMDALEKKKKRRFIFWLWFIIPGFAIGGSIGLYQIFSGSNKTTLVHHQTEQISTTTEKSADKNNSSSVSNNQSNTTTNTSSSSSIDEQTKETTVKQYTTIRKNESNTIVESNENSNKNTGIKNNNNIIYSKTNTVVLNQNEKQKSDVKNTSLTNTNRRINESTVHPFNVSLVSVPRTQTQSLLATKNIPVIQISPLEFIKPKHSKFSLGIYSDLGVSKSSFYTTIPVDSTPKGSYTSARSSADKFLFSYSSGISFRYSPVKFLAIETGIGFTHYESYQIIANSGVTTSSLMDSEPDTVLSFATFNPGFQEYHNTYDYISIPLKFYYQNRWKVFGIEAGGGVIFDIPVNTRSYAADENTGSSYLQKDVAGSRLNMFGIQAVGNVNVVFHIGKFSLFGGPTFKYRLNSMFDDQYIMQQRPYFIGGQIGVRYNF